MTERAHGSLRTVDSCGVCASHATAQDAGPEVSSAEALLLAAAVAGPALAIPESTTGSEASAASSMGIPDDAGRWASWGGTGPAPLHDAVAIRGVIRDISNRSEDLMSGDNDGAVSPSFSDANRVLRFANFADERQDYIAPLRDALMRVANGWNDGLWSDVRSDVTDVWELSREYMARF